MPRGRRGLLPVLVFHAGARPAGPAMAGRGRPSRGHRPETRRTARGHPMSAAEPKRALTDIPEAADISRLLGEVTGVASPPSPPRGSGPSGSLPSRAKPGEGREEPSPPSPLPQSRETG